MRRLCETPVLDGPTPDDFVGAVIRTHERIRSKLQALGLERAFSPATESPADERTISVYCRHHGVEAGAPHGLGPAEHRWAAG